METGAESGRFELDIALNKPIVERSISANENKGPGGI